MRTDGDVRLDCVSWVCQDGSTYTHTESEGDAEQKKKDSKIKKTEERKQSDGRWSDDVWE